MYFVIISWLALNITGQFASVGLVLVWRPLLSVAFGPFMGVLVDRFNRSSLFIVAQVLHTAGIAWLIFNVYWQSIDQIGLTPLYITACVVSLGILLSATTAQGLLQAVGGKTQVRIVTAGVTVIQAADILGVLFGGLAIAALGFEGGLAISAVCSIAAACFAVPLREKGRVSPKVSPNGESVGFFVAIADGFRLIFQDQRILITCLSIALTWSTSYISMALLAAFTLIELGLGPVAYGQIDAMWGVGAVVGSMILVCLPPSVVKHYLLRFGLLLLAVATANFSLAQGLWSALLLHGIMGVAFAVNRTSYDAYILMAVDSEIVGRVRNNIEATVGAAGILVFLSPTIYADFSIRTVYLGYAAVLAVAAAALMIWRYRLDTTERTTCAQPKHNPSSVKIPR